MPKRRTLAEYVAQVQEVHEGRIEVLGEYVNNYTKIHHRCNIDDHEWTPLPINVVNNRTGCPACKSRKSSESAGKLRTPRATGAEKRRALDMRAEGKTYRQIGEVLGRSRSTINTWCNPEVDKKSRLAKTKWREENREWHLATSRRYFREFEHGKACKRVSTAGRRAMKLDWYTNDPEDIAAMQAIFLECERLNRETKIEHQVDHIWPLSIGGPHLPWNLQILTAKENITKQNKFSDEDRATYTKNIADMFNQCGDC